MFVSKQQKKSDQISDRLAEIESELGHQGNQYIFLRSIWKSHSHQYTHAVVDLDDQLDRLNKIVAMMKKHINYSAKKQLNYQYTTIHQEITIRESKALETMSKAIMESEQYRTRVVQANTQILQLKKINEDLKQQIHQLKRQRKQDSKIIKQLTEKNANLENKILAANYDDGRSQISLMRSSRNFDKQLSERASLATINMSQSLHIPNLSKQNTDRQRFKSKSRYVNTQGDQKSWLNETLSIQSKLDESFMSMSSYGYLDGNHSMHRYNSHNQDKQNINQSCIFHYESERNLLKEKSIKKHRLKSNTRQEPLGESPKQVMKFIRQNSKQLLIRKSQKLGTQASAVQAK